ncbi:MAG: O-antigen ligase family protein [Elusimicrobiota bacterium]
MTRTTRLGFTLALAGGLLAVAPQFAEAYNLAKLLLLGAGAALAWAGLIGRPVRRTSLDLPIAALWAIMLASTALSLDPAASVLGMYPQQFYGLLPLALCTALFYAAASCDAAGADEFLAKLLIAVVSVMSAYGILQCVMGRPILTAEDLPQRLDNHWVRITSTIGSPVMFGGCLALMLPLVLREALVKKTLLGRAALVLVPTALLLTWARGSWASAALSAAAYAAFSGRLTIPRRHARLVGLACALAAVPAFILVQGKMKKGDSDSMRVEMIKSAIPAVESHPWLGSGPDTYVHQLRRFKTVRWVQLTHRTTVLQLSAHNDFLQAAITLGWPGLAAYLWILAALFVAIRKGLTGGNRDGLLAAIGAGLLGLFLQAKVNPITASTMAAAATLAGMAVRRGKTLPKFPSRAVAGLSCAALVAITAALVRLSYADILFNRGMHTISIAPRIDAQFMSGVGDLKRATEVNPWSMEYLAQRCEVIFRVSRIAKPEQGKQVIDKALELTEAGLRLHPGNPTAHELRSTALTLASGFGENTLPEAMTEIQRASSMDPTFTYSLRRRMDLARALNDRAEFERAKAEYLRIITLTDEVPDWNPIVL